MSTQIRGEQLAIEQVTADPVSPKVGQMWVKQTERIGKPMGLLLALTYSADTFYLSYQTSSGPIVRTELA